MTPPSTIDELGLCQGFVTELRTANLLKLADLDNVKRYLNNQPRAKPETLAKQLVSQGVLTQYQAETVLAGNTSQLTVWTYTLLEPLNATGRGTVFKVHNKAD